MTNNTHPDHREPIHAVVVTAREPNQHNRAFNTPLGGYSIVIRGCEKDAILWGAGYAKGQIPFVAHGIEHLLRWNNNRHPLIVSAEAGLDDYISKDGHVRAAMLNGGRTTSGKPMMGFDPLVAIAKQLDAGDWVFRRYWKNNRPRDFEVGELTAKQALNYAQRHLDLCDGTREYGIFATNETADILDIGKCQ